MIVLWWIISKTKWKVKPIKIKEIEIKNLSHLDEIERKITKMHEKVKGYKEFAENLNKELERVR